MPPSPRPRNSAATSSSRRSTAPRAGWRGSSIPSGPYSASSTPPGSRSSREMTIDGVETDIRALVEEERRSWTEFQALLACLSPDQAERPGYFLEGWSAKDLLAHVAGWLAEAGLVLEQIRVGTFNGKDMDIEGMNAVFLEANRPQPLPVVHTEASASRSRLL